MGIPAELYPTKMSHVSFWDITVADANYSQGIATVHPNKFCGFGPDDAERFARMIAAAPNLLEALRKARPYVGMVRSSDIDDRDPIFGVMDEIDAAIAKAEGLS